MQKLPPSIRVGARNEFDMTKVVLMVLACKASVKHSTQDSKRPEISILPRAQRQIGLGISALSTFEGLDSSDIWMVSKSQTRDMLRDMRPKRNNCAVNQQNIYLMSI